MKLFIILLKRKKGGKLVTIISDFVGTEGGCLDMGRDLKMINDNHARLIQKFPDYVSYNGHKEMMGGTFNKIKIQYKKAYLSSQINSLEEFMS